MPGSGAHSERILILAPLGRDAEVASALLTEAGRRTLICKDIAEINAELERGAALALITEEAVAENDLSGLSKWVAAQPAWSDIPIVLLTSHDDSPARVDRAILYQETLGNVLYLERPFHPTTLVNLVRSAIRSRQRQYEARATLERYTLLARELQHRTKNLLAVIQALATASLPAGPARETYFGRLHSLALAQDLVLEGDGGGASIMRLVEQALMSFGDRVMMRGTDANLSAITAQGFALILHELATNAVKHGALRAPGGTVRVEWSLKAGSPDLLVFEWRETGEPPAIVPNRTGFGTKLLEMAVATAECPRFDYSANGFAYRAAIILDPLLSDHGSLKSPVLKTSVVEG
jgi:two-component sensor histidine kinase